MLDKEKSIKIIIACHKKCKTPFDSVYLPVQVGAANSMATGYQRDDEGENISSKNPMYCELTGLYWAWKNLSCDYLGLVHYRRYFSAKSMAYRKGRHPFDCVLSEKQLRSLLDSYKLIVPSKRKYYVETLASHYAHTLDESHLTAARQVLSDLAPSYLRAFDRVLRQKYGYMFNMFISSKTIADEYCSWLFPILEELEKVIDSKNMSKFEKRWPGRVSEILFNVWLEYSIQTGRLRRSDVKEISCIYIGKIDYPKKVASFINAKLFHKKYEKSF